MPLTYLQAKSIIDLVTADPECRFRVTMDYGNTKDFFRFIPDSFGISGSIRNIWMMEQQVDVTEPENAAVVCTGIAEATTKVINQSIARLTGIQKAEEISREWPASHTATAITTRDGSTYVFDWHATLNLQNPMITLKEEWLKGLHDGKTFEKFSHLSLQEKITQQRLPGKAKQDPLLSKEDFVILH